MEIWILFGLILLCITGAVEAVKISELEDKVLDIRKELQENAAPETDSDFEEIYKKGLAGIMAYSLREAEGSDEL